MPGQSRTSKVAIANEKWWSNPLTRLSFGAIDAPSETLPPKEPQVVDRKAAGASVVYHRLHSLVSIEPIVFLRATATPKTQKHLDQTCRV
jgi:hypothetical protein